MRTPQVRGAGTDDYSPNRNGRGALALARALDYDPNHVQSLVTIAVPSTLNSLFPVEKFHNSTQVNALFNDRRLAILHTTNPYMILTAKVR